MPEVDIAQLKEAVKAINDSGEIEPKIKLVGISNEDLATQFTEAVEALAKAERDIPTKAVEIYNAMYHSEEEPEEEPEEVEPEEEPEKKPVVVKAKKTEKKKKTVAKKKTAEKKKPAVTKKKSTVTKKKTAVTPKKTEKKKSTAKKDDFGYTVGSKANLFAKSINNKTGKTMAEVKELDWNDKNATFYDIFNRLVEKGLAVKDEKTNKMKIKK